MSFSLKILIVIIAVFGGIYYELSQPPKIPKLKKNAYWGSGNHKEDDTSIRPFTINFSKEIINDLKSRLLNHRPFTPPLEGIQQQYGINTNLLQKFVEYWASEYKWDARQYYLNKMPQFKTKIQGLDIHFIHFKPKNVPKGVKVLPLLLLHGWPGSVVEFYDVIPLLTTPNEDFNFVFEVVIPSLPGFGFSEGPSKPGLSAREAAVVFNNLMKRLGFDQYYVQGGDLGSIIASSMAVYFPEKVKGVHLNMCISNSLKTKLKWLLGSLYPSLVVDKENEYRMYPVWNILKNQLAGTGYLHLQATKPDTLGVAINDSPSGLAAYILEKWSYATNRQYLTREDGGLLEKFTAEQLLDNLMYYYLPNTATTSFRMYAEFFNSDFNEYTNSIPIKVPSACLSFKHEIVYQPESFLRDRYHNLVHYKEHPEGGHFAAYELPKVFAQDVWEAINKIENPNRKN